MKVNWPGIVVVALIVTTIIAYKAHRKHEPVAEQDRIPTVLLVADLNEADSEDACADIIRSVREAGRRGVQVQELSPDSTSEVLRQYRVLTIPTVLILDRRGQVVSRFEGEDRQTVIAIRNQLSRLH
jgi:hypothetical protein